MRAEIEIAYPVFRCQSDEDVFFQRLSEVTGIQKIVEQGANIRLSVSADHLVDALKDVGAICDLWHTAFRLMDP